MTNDQPSDIVAIASRRARRGRSIKPPVVARDGPVIFGAGLTQTARRTMAPCNLRPIPSSLIPSLKSTTHRDAEASGREFRSSPLRYGNRTSAFLLSCSIQSFAMSGVRMKPIPCSLHPSKTMPLFSASWKGLPSTRPSGSSRVLTRRTSVSSAIRGTSGATPSRVPHTAAYSRLAVDAGQERLWIARVIVKPPSTMASRPTSRESPWATVFVAMSPSVPFACKSEVARRRGRPMD